MSNHPLVVHFKKEKYDVLVDRTTKFGNPFEIGKDGTRSEVIAKFKQFVLSNPEYIKMVKQELKGKVLGCWCDPKPCHASILAEIANDTLEEDLFN